MNQIISALLDRHAITEDNVITVAYTIRDALGRTLNKIGNFGIVSFEVTENNINFTMQDIIEKKRIKINDESIIAIDGMDISRYADVYDINKDGSNKKIGKKRGRKPKSQTV